MPLLSALLDQYCRRGCAGASDVEAEGLNSNSPCIPEVAGSATASGISSSRQHCLSEFSHSGPGEATWRRRQAPLQVLSPSCSDLRDPRAKLSKTR